MKTKTLIDDMLLVCTSRLADHAQARKALRAVCRYYGGQQLYIPRWKKESSRKAEELRDVLADAVGDPDGETVLDELMTKFGGFAHYIPLEGRAFRTDVAQEIYESYDGTTEHLGDLCRQYGITYTQVYRLWHLARDEKLQQQFDF